MKGLKYFVHRASVLNQYRAMLRLARAFAKVDPEAAKSTVEAIQREYRVETDLSTASAMLSNGERQMQALAELVRNAEGRAADPADPAVPADGGAASPSSWLATQDSEDQRGRVGASWPWAGARAKKRRRPLTAAPKRDLSAGGSAEDVHIDEWQRARRRPAEFYAREAEARRYYYTVDLQGRLFLEETSPKNVATSLKDARFLDFFWKRLRPNAGAAGAGGYPFVSPCGPESNFVLPADMPVVFHSLQGGALRWAGTLACGFDPSALRVSRHTGRLYHALPAARAAGPPRAPGMRFGLLRSSVAVALSSRLSVDAGGAYVIDGSRRIEALAEEEEPVWGAWTRAGG